MTGWRALASVVLMLLIFATGLFLGRKWEAANHADEAIKAANERLDAVVAGVEANNERARKLQQTLDRLPKAEGKVRDVVRENPSPCERPPAVSDSLREAVREANASRAVPADP